jgi:DNA ligase 1
MNELSPMLACPAPAQLRFPLYASPKIDGIRAVIRLGWARSRKMELIPNLHVQKLIRGYTMEGFDGELCVGPATAPDLMQKTQSGVMSRDGEPQFTYYVFDLHNRPGTPYTTRYADLIKEVDVLHLVDPEGTAFVQVLPQVWIETQEQLDQYELECLSKGYEGVMVRRIDGFYKFGRSTPKDCLLMKLKRFVDNEAMIIGFEEQMHNTNEDVRSKTGHAKRSTAKAGLVGTGLLGSMLVRDVKTGIEFGVGTGFTSAQRREYWVWRESLIGKFMTYKHFAATGVKEAPRFPVFKSFRDKIDFDL